VRLKRILIFAPLVLLAVLLQSFFWVPTYERQTTGNPERLSKFIDASIGDARFLNPVLSADSASSEINSLVFDSLLDLDEKLALRPNLAESWHITETAFLVVNERARLPDGRPAGAERLRQRIEAALGADASAVRIVPAETRTETRTLPIPPEAGGEPQPTPVSVRVEVPERIAVELVRVVPEVFERLEPVLGADYFESFDAAARVQLPDGPAGELLRPQTGSFLPLTEHNPVILFRLRRGVRFHDGHELDAGDVRFTYEAIMDPKNLSPRTSDFEPIKTLEVIDPHTVRVVYKRLFSPAVYPWSYMGILPEHRLDAAALEREMDRRGIHGEARASFGLREAEFTRHPVGTGPFRFVSWQSDYLIHLQRFDDHFNGPPEYADYFLRIIPDPLTQELEFRTGAIDTYPALPHQAARYQADEAYQSFSAVGFGYTYIGYNNRRPLFRDPRVRQALGMAIDVDQIIEYVLYGEGERVTGPYAITTEWYDPSVEPLPYDPDGALEILEGLGWRKNSDGQLEKDGKPLEFTLITNQGNPLRKAILTIAQNSWKKLGIRCETQVFEWAVFLKNHVNVGEFDAVILGWSTGVDPDQFQIWHSSQTGPQQLNFVGYVNDEADRLIQRIRQEYDPERQRALAHAFHRRIAADQPYTFLYAARATRVLDKKIAMVERVDGQERIVPIRPTPTGNLMYYFERWKKLEFVPTF
jgi:ABC-type transport system substrate-binding protein